ncbi:YaiI/YqxD family protein [Vallitalea longa]|uniref:YaiI/YqxD family protein n=1 Tax=Vallitalea longa TaxID=2936439 RepID=UPI002ED156F3
MLVDGDACPVKNIIIKIAKEYNIPVDIFIDSSHIYENDYCNIIVIGKGKDAVDFALINRTNKNDIIITGDYGVATMALSKEASAIHPNGFIYTNDNINRLLMERHISGQARRSKKRYAKMKKRSIDHDMKFEYNFRKLILSESVNDINI